MGGVSSFSSVAWLSLLRTLSSRLFSLLFALLIHSTACGMLLIISCMPHMSPRMPSSASLAFSPLLQWLLSLGIYGNCTIRSRPHLWSPVLREATTQRTCTHLYF